MFQLLQKSLQRVGATSFQEPFILPSSQKIIQLSGQKTLSPSVSLKKTENNVFPILHLRRSLHSRSGKSQNDLQTKNNNNIVSKNQLPMNTTHFKTFRDLFTKKNPSFHQRAFSNSNKPPQKDLPDAFKILNDQPKKTANSTSSPKPDNSQKPPPPGPATPKRGSFFRNFSIFSFLVFGGLAGYAEFAPKDNALEQSSELPGLWRRFYFQQKTFFGPMIKDLVNTIQGLISPTNSSIENKALSTPEAKETSVQLNVEKSEFQAPVLTPDSKDAQTSNETPNEIINHTSDEIVNQISNEIVSQPSDETSNETVNQISNEIVNQLSNETSNETVDQSSNEASSETMNQNSNDTLEETTNSSSSSNSEDDLSSKTINEVSHTQDEFIIHIDEESKPETPQSQTETTSENNSQSGSTPPEHPEEIPFLPLPNQKEEKEEKVLQEFKGSESYDKFRELLEIQDRFHKEELKNQEARLNEACKNRLSEEIQRVISQEEVKSEQDTKERLNLQATTLQEQFSLQKEKLLLEAKNNCTQEMERHLNHLMHLENVLYNTNESQDTLLRQVTDEMTYHMQLHHLSASLLSLSQIFDKKTSLSSQWSQLQTAAAFSPEISSVTRSVPDRILQNGISPTPDLQRTFPQIAKKVRENASQIPTENSPDLVSTLLNVGKTTFQKMNANSGLQAGDALGRAEWYLSERSDLKNAVSELLKDPQLSEYEKVEDFKTWIQEAQDNLIVQNIFETARKKTIALLQQK